MKAVRGSALPPAELRPGCHESATISDQTIKYRGHSIGHSTVLRNTRCRLLSPTLTKETPRRLPLLMGRTLRMAEGQRSCQRDTTMDWNREKSEAVTPVSTDYGPAHRHPQSGSEQDIAEEVTIVGKPTR
jgi:hypothetical protein